MFDTHINFAIGTVLSAPVDAIGETFVLMPCDGQFFAPDMPVTLCPPHVQPTADNSEIGYLTDVDVDTLTIIRAQEDSLPMRVLQGWQVIGSMTAKTLRDIEDGVVAAMADIETKQPLGDYPTGAELAAALLLKADAFTDKGALTALTAYAKGDIVSYKGRKIYVTNPSSSGSGSNPF